MTGTATRPTPARCRFCGATPLDTVYRNERSPASVEGLLHADGRANDRARDLNVLHCAHCGLVQLEDYLGDGFYADYEMGVGFSPRFLSYLEELADTLRSNVDGENPNLLELGCGDGAFLDALADRGFSVTGLEPSARFRRQAEARGHRVLNEFAGDGVPIGGAPYDVIASRQVMEHVHDLNGVLSAIAASLPPGGVCLTEVPSLDKALDDRRFYDFFPDHVNYFDRHTLASVHRHHGLEPIWLEPTFGDEFLTVIATNTERPGAAAASPSDPAPVAAGMRRLADDQRRVCGDLRQLLQSARDAGQRTCIWGGGGKGIVTLAAIGPDLVDLLVDGDPRKHGHYLPVSHLQVEAPERIAVAKPELIVVTALAHLDEILSTLWGPLQYSGEVFALAPGGLKRCRA